MNLAAVLINCENHDFELSSMFTFDESVLIADREKLMKIYGIGDAEAENMSLDDIIIDRITKLTVDY